MFAGHCSEALMMSTYRITEFANKYINHDMIEAHTMLPSLPDARARLLYCFLGENSAEEKQTLYTLAVSLAQLGLDTHDWVEPAMQDESLAQSRSRQLKVLAGDYFNGRFYQLLAQAGKVEVVRLVSKAICEVTRIKMSMNERFELVKLTAEEYLEQMVAINSELFLSFSSLISSSFRDANRYEELLRLFARCELICDEIKSLDSGEARRGWATCYILQQTAPESRDGILHASPEAMSQLNRKYETQNLLSTMLFTQLDVVKEIIEQFDSEELRAELGLLLEPFRVRVGELKAT
jgi:heptaprenyl diphosphate synthase